ncbi:MAG: anti-sigma factor antagonist [Actinophytocola sp.]|nr:anti-sigma factor antagonist [Actinophytocola sp.]
MSMQPLHVDSHVFSDSIVVEAHGAVDVSTAETLEYRLRSALAASGGRRMLVLDLARVEFFGTVGLQLLIWADQECRERDVTLWVVATDRAVLRPIEVSGLTGRFHITSTMPPVNEYAVAEQQTA